jgi:hypothetical protein
MLRQGVHLMEARKKIKKDRKRQRDRDKIPFQRHASSDLLPSTTSQ